MLWLLLLSLAAGVSSEVWNGWTSGTVKRKGKYGWFADRGSLDCRSRRDPEGQLHPYLAGYIPVCLRISSFQGGTWKWSYSWHGEWGSRAENQPPTFVIFPQEASPFSLVLE